MAPSRDAAAQIVDVYCRLALAGQHLLADVVGNTAPRAWAHYPSDDARDIRSGYQWFYHSHGADDRPGSAEHGHIHLFARAAAWRGVVDFDAERRWRRRLRIPGPRARSRHLLCIGFDAKGVPNSLFTVNRWVTGEALLSATSTARLLKDMRMATGHAEINQLLCSVVALCAPEIDRILSARDEALLLRSRLGPDALEDPKLELLSEARIDLDDILHRDRH